MDVKKELKPVTRKAYECKEGTELLVLDKKWCSLLPFPFLPEPGISLTLNLGETWSLTELAIPLHIVITKGERGIEQ